MRATDDGSIELRACSSPAAWYIEAPCFVQAESAFLSSCRCSFSWCSRPSRSRRSSPITDADARAGRAASPGDAAHAHGGRPAPRADPGCAEDALHVARGAHVGRDARAGSSHRGGGGRARGRREPCGARPRVADVDRGGQAHAPHHPHDHRVPLVQRRFAGGRPDAVHRSVARERRCARRTGGFMGTEYNRGVRRPSMFSFASSPFCGHGRGSAILKRRPESTVPFHRKTEKIA